MRSLVLLVLFSGCQPAGSYWGERPSPPPTCTGGAELVNNTCYCAHGTTWNGLICQGTPNAATCTGNSYPFGPAGFQKCYCLDGYKLDGAQCIALQCTGGAVASGDRCVCREGAHWNGSECLPVIHCGGGSFQQGNRCACPSNTTWNGEACAQPTCNGGALWSNGRCICPPETSWDGYACAGRPPPSCNGGAVWRNSRCVCPDGSDWQHDHCAEDPSGPEDPSERQSRN